MVRYNLYSLMGAAVLFFMAVGMPHAGNGFPTPYDGLGSDEVDQTILAASPQLVVGRLSSVGSSWQTVSLPFEYDDMVVVATPAYTNNQLPAVVRIRDAKDNSFEVRVQNPSGETLSGYTVQYLVVEEGKYTQDEDGVTMEAVLEEVKETNSNSAWEGEEVAYENNYISPVVLGQVMTFEDEAWSVFWSHGILANSAPSPNFFHVGKHVGEDPTDSRNEETVGYVVFEAGTGLLDGYTYQAIAGIDAIRGMEDSPPYSYSHQMESSGFVIATQAGMDGPNGSWAVLWGDDPLEEDVLLLAVDEDQVLDEERVHSTEQVHVLIFNTSQPAPEILSFSPDAGIVGDEVTLFGNYFTGTNEVLFNGVAAPFTVNSDQSIVVEVPLGATTGLITVATSGGQATTATPFTLLNVPQVFTFLPEEGPRGTVVVITGQNFVEVEDVSFGGWSSKSYEVVSESQIIATVPPESNTGRIRVRNAAGMATTPEVFRVISSAAVEDIIPDRAEVFATISITGAGLLETESVAFAGGVEAEFTILSDEVIQVTVPLNTTSGPVNVVFEDGTVLQGPVDFTLTYAEPLQGLNLCRLTSASLSQSSTNEPFATPSKACDGETDGSLANESFTDTETENEAWWEVDLGGLFNISEVAVWNRVDCCQGDLSGFYIFIKDTPFDSKSLTFTLNDDGVDAYFVGEVELFESVDAGRTGRYIRVQKEGTGKLVLAEVEVVSGEGNVATNVEDDMLPESLSLDKAYPSPFQTQATIRYHLAESDHVYLSVFDVLGREVSVLQNSIMPAGTHQAHFNAETLPNGVYFYRLESRGAVLSKSVILAR